jgi:hypothetical protein
LTILLGTISFFLFLFLTFLRFVPFIPISDLKDDKRHLREEEAARKNDATLGGASAREASHA